MSQTGVEYVVVYMETADVDYENIGVADIQKNVEDVEADYYHIVAKKIMCAFESEVAHDVFKKTRASRTT